jgi:hypothetical protein
MNWWRFLVYFSWKYHWHWRIVEAENKIRAYLGKNLKTFCSNCEKVYVQDLGEHPPDIEFHPDPWLLCPTCRGK